MPINSTEGEATKIIEPAEEPYPGSLRMVSSFLQTLKKTEIVPEARPSSPLPRYTSKSALWLFLCRPANLETTQQADLAAFRQLHPSLDAAYQLTQDFWVSTVFGAG